MAQLLGADVHQKVFALRILAIEPLDRILHRRGELAVGAAELLEQHVAEARVGLVDADGVHELLDVVIHESPRMVGSADCVSSMSNGWAERMFLAARAAPGISLQRGQWVE